MTNWNSFSCFPYMKTLLHFWIESIFDKLEHLFPLFSYMKTLFLRAKNKKNNRKWIWNSKKKRIRILVHILTFIAQCLPISQKKSIDLRNLKCLKNYVNAIKKMVFCFRHFFELKQEKNAWVIKKTFLKFESKGQKFSVFSRWLEQVIRAVKGQNIFWKQYKYLLTYTILACSGNW